MDNNQPNSFSQGSSFDPSPHSGRTRTQKLQAILLRTFQAGSDSKVMVFFSREVGQIRCVVRPRSLGGKSGSKSLPPGFADLELELINAAHADQLSQLKEWSVAHGRSGLENCWSILNWNCALLLGEFLLATTHEGESHEYLFDMFHRALDLLETTSKPLPLVAAFLIKAMHHLGYDLRLARCRCGKSLAAQHPVTFSYEDGGVVCPGCLARFERSPGGDQTAPHHQQRALSATEVEFLADWRSASFDRVLAEDYPAHNLARLVELLLNYVEYHCEVRLKSRQTLNWNQFEKPTP